MLMLLKSPERRGFCALFAMVDKAPGEGFLPDLANHVQEEVVAS